MLLGDQAPNGFAKKEFLSVSSNNGGVGEAREVGEIFQAKRPKVDINLKWHPTSGPFA